MITPKGNYSNTETYEILDLVTYNGSSYICKKNSTNISPTVESNWQICSLKGDKGEQGITGNIGEKGETGNGITTVEKTKTEGLVDTYTITYSNGDTQEIQITNGKDFDEKKLDTKLENYEKKHTYYTMTVIEEIEAEQEVELPCSYIVGNDNLVIFHNGDRLICEKNPEDLANYKEVGETGTISNKVLFGWDLRIGDVLDFIVKGVVENEENEN